MRLGNIKMGDDTSQQRRPSPQFGRQALATRGTGNNGVMNDDLGVGELQGGTTKWGDNDEASQRRQPSTSQRANASSEEQWDDERG